jgi:hypothetical protein
VRNYAATVLAGSYADGCEDAAEETGLLDLPATCPWTLGQVLDRDFWPGLPWEADEP